MLMLVFHPESGRLRMPKPAQCLNINRVYLPPHSQLTYGFSGAHDGHQILTDFSHISVTDPHFWPQAALLVATYPYKRLVSLRLLEWVLLEYKCLLPNA
jgi:hypothetical protein